MRFSPDHPSIPDNNQNSVETNENKLEIPEGWLKTDDIFELFLQEGTVTADQKNKLKILINETRRLSEWEKEFIRPSHKTHFHHSPKFIDFLRGKIKESDKRIPENWLKTADMFKLLVEEKLLTNEDDHRFQNLITKTRELSEWKDEVGKYSIANDNRFTFSYFYSPKFVDFLREQFKDPKLEIPAGWLTPEEIGKFFIDEGIMFKSQQIKLEKLINKVRKRYSEEQKIKLMIRTSPHLPFSYSPEFVESLKVLVKPEEFLPKAPLDWVDLRGIGKILDEEFKRKKIHSGKEDGELLHRLFKRHIEIYKAGQMEGQVRRIDIDEKSNKIMNIKYFKGASYYFSPEFTRTLLEEFWRQRIEE